MIRRAVAMAIALACACTSATSAPVVPAGCQPLEGDLSCTLPYPSDFFLSSGVVAMSGAAKPVTSGGIDADLVTPLHADGFSRQPTIACALPDSISTDGLPNVTDVDPTRSENPLTSPTILFRPDTGEAIPHYVDVDPNPDDATHVVITIRPLVQLAPSTRYVVALYGVKNLAGLPAAPAEGFREIRDGGEPTRFDADVFAPLAKKGIARPALQLAWDFTTQSASWAERDMLAIRDQTLAWLEAHASPLVVVTNVAPGTAEYFREITGTVTVPYFMDQPGSGALLHRDSSGNVAQNGTVDVPFKIVVPNSVEDAWGPARGIAFGHGFFGSTAEMDAQPARTLLSSLGVVAFGIDWWGMSQDDLGTVVGLISSTPSQLGTLTDRVHQAMANWLVMTRAMKTSLAGEVALHRPLFGNGVTFLPNGKNNGGTILYDPSHVQYFGASLGGILGSVMSALNPDVERAVINVGGSSWGQMMPRASPFSGFNFFIESAMGDELGAQTLEAMFVSALDSIDSATYATYLIGSKLPGNPDRKIIMQNGIGDAEVPNPASFFEARILGLSMVSPSPETVFGIPLADPSGLSSAMTLWDFGISPSVYAVEAPPDPNAVHNGLRDEPTAIAQMNAFLRPNGVVTNPCGGPCASGDAP
jgi:hypothetical protein